MTAWKLTGPALSELLEADAPQLSEQLRSVAERIPGVKCVEKVRVRKSGACCPRQIQLPLTPHFCYHLLSKV